MLDDSRWLGLSSAVHAKPRRHAAFARTTFDLTRFAVSIEARGPAFASSLSLRGAKGEKANLQTPTPALLLGDGEIELGKINEAWDIGLMPEPENAPLQFLLIEKADKASEEGSRTPQQKAALSRARGLTRVTSGQQALRVLTKSVSLT